MDTLLVALMLLGGRSVTVEAVLARDSTLLLPAGEVAALLGTGAPIAPWVTVRDLSRAWPTVAFTWDARALVVYVSDPLAVLPASREARARGDAQARGATYIPRSGPFAAFTGDDRGRSAWEGGYSYKGRVAVTARRTVSGASWGLSVAPSSALFLSYYDGDRMRPMASARIAAGPAWLSATWQNGAAALDALLALPHVAVFASSRETFAVTLTAAPVGVQVGRSGGRIAARVTYGPVPPSPFVVPQVN